MTVTEHLTEDGHVVDVQVHDFTRVEILERNQYGVVEEMFEEFAKDAAVSQTALFRQPVTFEFHDMFERTWSEVMHRISDPVQIFTFSLSPLAGTSLLILPTTEALAMVDIRLAGDGQEDYEGKQLTDIEQELLVPVMGNMLDGLSKALSELQATTPFVGKQFDELDTVTTIAGPDSCLAARFSISVAGRPTKEMVVCLPAETLRQLAEIIRKGPGQQVAMDPRAAALHIARRLRDVPFDVILQFPSFVTTTERLLSLSVGDELHLGHSSELPLEVRAEGMLVARATIGRSGLKKACAITEEVLP